MAAVSGLTAGRYALGVVTLAIVAGSLAFAAVRIRRRWLHEWTGAPARLAECVIGIALLTGVMQVLGTVGLFRLVPLVVGCAVVGLVSAWALPGGDLSHPRGTRSGETVPWLGLAAVVVAVVVLAEWAGPTLISYRYGIRTFDSLWYHLPWAASFAQSGQITTLHFTDVEYLTAFYPATAELFHGLGIVLFGADVLSPGLNLAWLGLVLLGGYCTGLRFGVPTLTMLGAAVAMATPMMLLSQGGSAANDVVGVGLLVAAVGLLASDPGRPAEGPPAPGPGIAAAANPTPAALALAGLAAGLAISVKLSMLAPAVALTVGVLWWRRGRRPAALWLVPLVLAGAYWYLRNLIAVGNPVPWVNLPGLAVPAAPLQANTGFSIVHYLFSGKPWHGILAPGLAGGLGSWWWAVLAAAVIGPLLCLLPGAGTMVRMLGVVALVSWLAYLLTPESAAGPQNHPLGFAFNLRYSAPALTLSLMVTPLAPLFRAARGRIALGVGLLAVLVATLAHGRLWPSQFLAGQLIVGVVVALALAALMLRLPRSPLVPATALALALVAVVLGFPGQRSYLRSRYVFQPHISQLSRLWAFFRQVHGARVGIVGTYGGFFAYPLFGVDDSNRVQYLAARGAHGSLTPIVTCPAWRRAINAAGVDYVVTTPARNPWRPRVLTRSPEAAWTAGDPAAVPVFRSRAGAEQITAFRLEGPLNPAGCSGG